MGGGCLTFIYGNGLDYIDSPFEYATPTMYRDIPTDTDEVIRVGFNSAAVLTFADSTKIWAACNVSLSLVPDYGNGVYYLHDHRHTGSKVAHRYIPDIVAAVQEAEPIFDRRHRNIPWFFFIGENDKDPRLNRVYERRLAPYGFVKAELWDDYEGVVFSALVKYPNAIDT